MIRTAGLRETSNPPTLPPGWDASKLSSRRVGTQLYLLFPPLTLASFPTSTICPDLQGSFTLKQYFREDQRSYTERFNSVSKRNTEKFKALQLPTIWELGCGGEGGVGLSPSTPTPREQNSL